jgi:hypothetical protein
MRWLMIGAVLLAAACSGGEGTMRTPEVVDVRTFAWGGDTLRTGMTAEEVFAVVPEGTREWAARYSVEGGVVLGYAMGMVIDPASGALIQTFWLHNPEAPYTGEPRRDLTPLIFREGSLLGLGWEEFDEVAELFGLALPVPAEGVPAVSAGAA